MKLDDTNNPDDEQGEADVSVVAVDMLQEDSGGQLANDNQECLAQSLAHAICDTWGGVLLGGVLFPLAMVVVGVFYTFGYSVWMYWQSGDYYEMPWEGIFTWGLALAFMGGFVGCFLAALASIVAMNLVLLWSASFPRMMTPRGAASMFSGLAGFLAIASLWMYGPIGFSRLDFSEAPLLLGLFAAATAFGQFMGGRHGRKYGNRQTFTGPMFVRDVQFSIREMFLLTMWAAGVFALNNLFSGHDFLLLAAGYVVIQSVLLLLESCVTRWWWRRKANQSRLVQRK